MRRAHRRAEGGERDARKGVWGEVGDESGSRRGEGGLKRGEDGVVTFPTEGFGVVGHLADDYWMKERQRIRRITYQHNACGIEREQIRMGGANEPFALVSLPRALMSVGRRPFGLVEEVGVTEDDDLSAMVVEAFEMSDVVFFLFGSASVDEVVGLRDRKARVLAWVGGARGAEEEEEGRGSVSKTGKDEIGREKMEVSFWRRWRRKGEKNRLKFTSVLLLLSPSSRLGYPELGLLLPIDP
jgi:hypothetical protein